MPTFNAKQTAVNGVSLVRNGTVVYCAHLLYTCVHLPESGVYYVHFHCPTLIIVASIVVNVHGVP